MKRIMQAVAIGLLLLFFSGCGGYGEFVVLPGTVSAVIHLKPNSSDNKCQLWIDSRSVDNRLYTYHTEYRSEFCSYQPGQEIK